MTLVNANVAALWGNGHCFAPWCADATILIGERVRRTQLSSKDTLEVQGLKPVATPRTMGDQSASEWINPMTADKPESPSSAVVLGFEASSLDSGLPAGSTRSVDHREVASILAGMQRAKSQLW
jgi:hypothetical protein